MVSILGRGTEVKTEHKGPYSGPLKGLNIIDFGRYYAGPMASLLLADQGANVIRIVRPGKKELPNQQYRLMNRNKKLLVLDLKTDDGKAQALSLIRRADVVIENFRPGVMKRLGMDYASVRVSNPGLIYLSLPGFASTDKKRAHIQAWEGILNAAAGVYTNTSLFRQQLHFPPVFTSVPLCSVYGGVNGATAIMAALLAREEHGYGSVLEVPLADNGVTGFFLGAVDHPSVPQADAELPANLKPLVFSPKDSRRVMEDKLETARQATYWSPTNRAYPCADGRQIFINTFDTGLFVGRTIKALGIDKQLMQEGFVNAGTWELGLDNNICECMGLNPERTKRFSQLIADALLTRTAKQWESILEKAGVPAGVVRSRDEWLSLKPLKESGVFTEMDDGDSVLTVPGRLVDISGPGDVLMETSQLEASTINVSQADSLLNSNTIKKVLQNTPLPLRKGDLLRELKVLDLSNLVAGPMSSYVLAQYGAQVIKADPPCFLNPGMLLSTLELSQGKRSILADFKTLPGRDILKRLVSWADVVIHNSLDDVAVRLGITPVQLRELNPNIVVCQLSAFGGTHRGGWEMRQGFDALLQSVSGLMAQYGSLERPHWHGMVSCGDVLGGRSLAFAALLAVYQQRKTGCVAEARTSLARVVNYAQFPYMIAENGNSDWGEPSGQFAVGEYWWQRLYACRDGWIYVGTSEDRAYMLGEIVTKCAATSESVLAATFIEQDCAYWVKKLDAADIACHQVKSLEDIQNENPSCQVSNQESDELAGSSLEFLRWEEHPCGYSFTSLAPNWVRVGEEHSYKRLNPAPKLGEQTTEILAELGYKKNEISELLRLKVAFEFLPTLGKSSYFFE